MKNLRVKLAATEKALVEKDKALKLVEAESGKLSEERNTLMLGRESLERKVAALTAEIAPAEDKSEDTKDLKTWAKLVACFQLALDDAQAASEGSFDNTMNQMRVLNPGVELNTLGMGVNCYVADGHILVLNYLRDIIDQLAGDPARLLPIIKREAEG